MTQCIALLRGINVGRAKRIAMGELRAAIEELGFTGVRTLLNSGNVVFEAKRPNIGKTAAAISAAIQTRFGFTVPVIVLSAQALATIIAECKHSQTSVDPSRFLVAFVANSSALAKAKPLLAQAWEPDAISLGGNAAYLWCASGIIESKLLQAFSRATGDEATARNWATVLKLQALVSANQNSNSS